MKKIIIGCSSTLLSRLKILICLLKSCWVVVFSEYSCCTIHSVSFIIVPSSCVCMGFTRNIDVLLLQPLYMSCSAVVSTHSDEKLSNTVHRGWCGVVEKSNVSEWIYSICLIYSLSKYIQVDTTSHRHIKCHPFTYVPLFIVQLCK